MIVNERERERESKAFSVRVGVHQGSVFNPVLFVIVLETLSREFREGLPQIWNFFIRENNVDFHCERCL